MNSQLAHVRVLIATGLVSVATALSGCSALSGEAEVDQDKVAAAFYPLAYAAERVAGEHLDVINLTSPGVEPHDLELGVKQTADISDAALVIYEGGFQPAVDATVEENAAGRTLDVVDLVELQPIASHDDEAHEDEAHEDEAHEDEAHEDEAHEDEAHEDEAHEDETHEDETHEDETHEDETHEDEAEDEHGHGDEDPHFWQDPLLMADLADGIAAELSEIEPDHAEDFAANAAAFRAELEQLDADFADGLADCDRDLVVVNHDAFGYLSKYGLHLEPINGLSPDAEGSISTRREIQEMIREEGLTTVFSETLAEQQTTTAIAADLGVRTDVLDPLEGLTEDAGADADYLSIMRTNLSALQKANGC